MRKHKNSPGQEAAVDMTPMLDIVFIMLIFFIVTSTFIRESGLDLTEHKSDDRPEEQLNSPKAAIVKVCANGDISIDGRLIDARSVRANVERKLAEDSSTVVIIETEKEAPTGKLVMAIDQARTARAHISVSPEPAYCRR
ncbi:MAG TPA: biopolymer transporter ExbD [Gammaproteobacteria bacterium]|jgi:biopolymer transport protein ExbD